MRRAARVDANHAEIVAALRKVGASVVSLAPVGQGCPDVLVGYQGRNHLLEIKDGSKKPSARRLNVMQERWHDNWRGSSCTVNSVEAALAAIGVIPVIGSIS